MLQMVDDNAMWISQPPRWLFPPRVPNIEVGVEMCYCKKLATCRCADNS